MLCLVLTIQIFELKKKNQTLIEKKLALQETLDEQYKRSDDLEQQRIYVQTKKYIEEKAKDLGYIYPDELILKPIK